MVMRSYEFFYLLICAVHDEAYQGSCRTVRSNGLAAAALPSHSKKPIRILTYSTDSNHDTVGCACCMLLARTGLVEPVPKPLVWMVRVSPVEWFLLFRWEALLASSTEWRFTLGATRAGPYSHDRYQGYSAFAFGMA
jgi:hypothetical protein